MYVPDFQEGNISRASMLELEGLPESAASPAAQP